MEIAKVLKVENGFKVNNQFFIPEDENNKDYQDILSWVAKGNEIKLEFTPEQIAAKALDDAKATKIYQLKLERDRLLSSSHSYPITVDGVSCKFALSNTDLPNLIARQSCLTSNSETSGWNDVNGNRVELNNAAFLSLIRHINSNDVDVWALYTAKLEEITKKNITLEELNAVTINLI